MKNLEFRLKKIEDHLISIEKKMDEPVKLVNIFGLMIIIILVTKINMKCYSLCNYYDFNQNFELAIVI